jgi:hypothetical protein
MLLGLRHSERSWHYEQPDEEVLMPELIATKSTEDGRRHGFLEQKSPGLTQPLVHTAVCRDLSKMKIKMLRAHFRIVNCIPGCSFLLEVFSSLLEKGIMD